MNGESGFTAELLMRSAGGYGGVAAAQLIDREPQLREQSDAMVVWKEHLTQRVLELSAALRAGEATLFTERVLWARKTFAAREFDDRLIAVSLQSLRDVLEAELPKKARDGCLEYIDAALAALDGPVPAVDDSELDVAKPGDRLTLQYLQLALEGRAGDAVALLKQAVDDGLDVSAAYTEVLMPAQKEIGRLWHANEVSVAEEHLVTATSHQAMAFLLHSSPRQPGNGCTLLAACVPGNVHDIALRALTDLFQLAGWRTIYLGSNVPAKDLPVTIEHFQADLVLLGSTLSTHVEPAARVIAAIRENTDRPVKIMVGGAAFDEVPGLWEKVAADAYAPDAAVAIELGAGLLAD